MLAGRQAVVQNARMQLAGRLTTRTSATRRCSCQLPVSRRVGFAEQRTHHLGAGLPQLQ